MVATAPHCHWVSLSIAITVPLRLRVIECCLAILLLNVIRLKDVCSHYHYDPRRLSNYELFIEVTSSNLTSVVICGVVLTMRHCGGHGLRFHWHHELRRFPT